jgi:hypothetical protein
MYANTGNLHGGGIDAFESALDVVNCTFVDNQASSTSSGEDIYAVDASFTLGNSIFWPVEPGQIFGSASSIDASFCVFNSTSNLSVTDVTGNFWTDTPGFVDETNPQGPDGIWGTVDDGLILSDSPLSECIDAGDNGLVPTELSTDLTGRSRIVDGDPAIDPAPVVDVGAYETQ